MFVSYVLVALVQCWPLPAHLSTRLTSDPVGDGGVYVWNTWVFRHEMVDGDRSPFYTDRILALEGPADLSLHNYTASADLLTLPLQPLVGVVAAFNLAYLINVALPGLGMFLLARRIGRPAVGLAEAWLAGFFFMCAPFLVARGEGHYSLAAAAPLPFFAWCLDRAWQGRRLRDASAAGACVAWAFYCDPYYAVYCVIIGAAMIAGYVLEIRPARDGAGSAGARRALDIAMAVIALAVTIVHVFSGGSLRVGPWTISVRSLYTPMLVLGVLGAVRIWMQIRPRARWFAPPDIPRLLRLAIVSIGAAIVLLAPVLYALARRAMDGRLVGAPVPWRSSAPGVDLLSFLVPNPTHPLAPRALVDWVARQPGGFVENVAALSWVVLAVIGLAWWRARARPNRTWFALALVVVSLAVGPFLRVAGIDTFLPTPWTFVRYVPVIGEARMPGRIAIVAALAIGVMFAGALAALARRAGRRRRLVLAAVGVLLACELWSAPRTLYSAAIPRIYGTIARDARPVAVLELPFGLKDGLLSVGDFSPGSQFRQTAHGKPLLGAYLSRISPSKRAAYEARAVTGALITLSARQPLDDAHRAAALAAAPAFLADSHLGYVVMDEARTTPALRAFAIQTLGLTEIDRSDGFALYVPAAATQQ
jgi:hypothetical protein